MDTSRFINRCNAAIRGEVLNMHLFGGSDFSEDDFSDFGSDIVGEVIGTAAATEGVVATATTDCTLVLENIIINPVQPAVLTDSLENDMRAFFEFHRFDTSSIPFEKLYVLWNAVYHDNTPDNLSCINKYLMMRYMLRFDSSDTLKKAMELGMDFICNIRMSRRLCVSQDVDDLASCYRESWYDASAFDMFSDSPVFNKPLIELLKTGKYNADFLNNCRNSPMDFFSCIRLATGVSEEKQGVDRFSSIRSREDFPELYNIIMASENSGIPIHQEIIEQFSKAFYLPVILRAESQSRLDLAFAENFLQHDLGTMAFIADIYDNGSVNLGLDTKSFFRAKILTDANSFRLNIVNFKPDFDAVYKRLLYSHFVGNLSQNDYNRFLTAVSLKEHILNLLNSDDTVIDSYNAFWLRDIFKELGISLQGDLPSLVGDDILFMKVGTRGKEKHYLQIDNYVLCKDSFMELLEGAYSYRIVNEGAAVIIVSKGIEAPAQIDVSFGLSGSFSTWVSTKISKEAAEQFSEYGSVIHANLINAIVSADKEFEVQRKKAGSNDYEYYRVSSSILKFFKLPIDTYFKYDKMFSFIADSNVFIGLLRSPRCVGLLQLFVKAYIYGNHSKVMMMFLYCFFKCLSPSKFSSNVEGFEHLDPLCSTLFIKGLNGRVENFSYRNLINSLDDLVTLLHQYRRVSLYITNNVINLEFTV